MKRTYDFATIGFRPYTETEEFVTIGVVALDTRAGHFGFTLLDARKTGRIGAMFPAVRSLYKEARHRLESELTAIERAVNGAGPGADVPFFPELRAHDGGLFAAITNPREGVFCYPVKGRRMAADMAGVLDALGRKFIDRNQLTPQQAVEQQMASHLRAVLNRAGLLPAFKRDVRIGPEDYRITFTLAHMERPGIADRALRPLNFDLPTATDIFLRGDDWINRLRRLKRTGFRPGRCLFTLNPPRDDDGLRQTAFAEIREELLANEVELASDEETDKIVDFARFPEDGDLKLA